MTSESERGLPAQPVDTYHIYDDFKELVKISLDRPTDKSYTLTVVKEIIFDPNTFEEALI